LSENALRTLVVLSAFNALLTLAYPMALLSPFLMWELSASIQLLALLSVILSGTGCFTILGLRRFLAVECGFDGASRALAIHAWVNATSGIAILVGWGVLRLGSSDSEISWALGISVLGFFLVVGIVIGALELLVGIALNKASAEGYGLLGPIRIIFIIVGGANLVSLIFGFTIIFGMVGYIALTALLFLLFHAAWRERTGHLPEGFRYRTSWIATIVTVSVLAVVVPGAVAVDQLRTFLQDTEEETVDEHSKVSSSVTPARWRSDGPGGHNYGD
jgi:hypothetical protein